MVSKLKFGIDAQRARRAVLRMGAGGVLAVGLAACGGGGGDGDSGDVDLRAAYDRINRNCMTYADVDNAIGRSADETPTASRRRWVSGNQNLTVLFTELNSGTYVVGVAIWNIVPGGELEKRFQFECGAL